MRAGSLQLEIAIKNYSVFCVDEISAAAQPLFPALFPKHVFLRYLLIT